MTLNSVSNKGTVINHYTAITFRSIAIFAILYQLRFVADELADTSIFITTLLFAFAGAIFIAGVRTNGKNIHPLAAVVSIALSPWLVRLLIAAPRLFISGENFLLTVEIDSLLLNFDRNNFVSLLPFYWLAASTLFALRSRTVLRAAVIIDVIILVAIFCFTRVADFTIYRWPIVLIVLLAGIIFMQALALLFSLPPEINLRKSEKIFAIAALLILIFFGGLLFLKPAQERAVQKGGGLLEPKLFSFDFSQFLRLDTEISMSDDLILIVKKDHSSSGNDNHVLLRRSVLSGYNKKQGFYRLEEMDEKTHPQYLPSRPTTLSPPDFKLSKRVNQEYFIVNFDASAFIGMKEPVEIIPYETWDASSFKSAYAVESLTSDAVFDFFGNNGSGDYIPPDFSQSYTPREFGLSEKEFALYTAYGDDERIRELAEELTFGIDSYGGKVEFIHDWLKYGDFRYSLKPGIAPDGDQLAWFLFQSKKGYCSYYAFAMALMLRSLGIPARVAAGFFIDPDSRIFDYYPVRSDMAHAWVEVPFPGYGWIEFDPTSENLAEGEEFRFSSGVDPDLIERLMREILENRSQLKVKIGPDGKNLLTDSRSLAALTSVIIKKILLPLLILLVVFLFVMMRIGWLLLSLWGKNDRKKAVYLWKHTRQRLKLAGFTGPSLSFESEWALRNDALINGTYGMYLGFAAARFAPEYHHEDFVSLQNTYRVFAKSYRKKITPLRRFLAWILPPFALILRNRKLPLLLLLFFLISMDGRAQNDEVDPAMDANNIYRRAIQAEYSELWERAIDLYQEGNVKYPHDIRFPRSLGQLYYNRALYGLAWDEYRKAEMINPMDTLILHRLANTAGHLNQDWTSVSYLERVLAIDPDFHEAISNLGWMYYKVHRLDDGRRLLLSALDRFGDDADFSMTLATVYSDMYLYNEGKSYYQKAIALAESARSFTAVAHYNLSILESRFYQFDLAWEEANASLEAQNRASGLLARGELNMWRLELEKAQADFNDAREIDSSTLSKLNLAQTYQISGRLEEARLYALDCLKAGDQSWMINYGIDPVRYKRDIHEILYKTYSGLANSERFTSRSVFKTISFRFYAAVHRKLFQKFSLASGDAYAYHGNAYPRYVYQRYTYPYDDSGTPLLDQYAQYYKAFETYPRRALYYLNKARDFETSIIPESAATYNLDRGLLLHDTGLIVKALADLNPVWERELISQGYRELAKPGTGHVRQIHAAAAAELFALNRGALLQAGIRLPVEISLKNTEGKRENSIYRMLAKAGFARVKDGTARFKLEINFSDGFAACELTDSEGEVRPLHRAVPLQDFARMFGGFVFRVE